MVNLMKKIFFYSFIILNPLLYFSLFLLSINRDYFFAQHWENFNLNQRLITFIIFLFLLIIYFGLFKYDIKQKSKIVILVIILLTCLITPPFFSRDLMAYILGGNNLLNPKINPYTQNLNTNPNLQPIYDQAPDLWWLNTPSNYGPIFLLLCGLLGRFRIEQHFLLAIYIYKFFSLILFLFSGFFLHQLLKEKNLPQKILWFYYLNPAILINLVLESHNDIFLVSLFFLIFLVKKNHFFLTSLYFTSIFIKYFSLILLPFIWFKKNSFNWRTFIISNISLIFLIISFFTFFSLNPFDYWKKLMTTRTEGICLYNCSPFIQLTSIFDSFAPRIRLITFIILYFLIFYFTLVKEKNFLTFIFWELFILFFVYISWLPPWYLTILIALTFLFKQKNYQVVNFALTIYSLLNYF